MPNPALVPAIIAGATALAGVAQTAIAKGKERRAQKKQQQLVAQREAFETAPEVPQIAQLTAGNAGQGFSDETMSYLTGEAGAGLSAGLGTATRLGADPNDISGILAQYYRQIAGIGGQNEMVKMQKFDQVTAALQLLASNRDAEWQSAENLTKDRLQTQAANVAAAGIDKQSGVNLITNAAALAGQIGLYSLQNPKVEPPPAGVDTSAYTLARPAAPVQIPTPNPASVIVPPRRSAFG